MKLIAIHAAPLTIPFTASFKHAAAERSKTQSLMVEVRSQSGLCGFGEGCPREYVSAEDLSTALEFVAANRSEWLDAIHDLDSLRCWVQSHESDIDANPAAWTAVELALLDLLGKEQQRSIDALLGLPELAGVFSYTAVLGDSEPARFRAELQRYCALGFTTFKIKLSGILSRDLAKVRALTEGRVPNHCVRADANNLWREVNRAAAHMEALGLRFSALEEPLMAGDYRGLAELGQRLETPIILDEGLLREEQLHHLGQSGAQWIINVRVSKMGGLLRCLRVIKTIREYGFGLVIGAQVGETSLLTRAALSLANHSADILWTQEGAFGTHLLAADVTATPLMFGAKGQLDPTVFGLAGRAGLGVEMPMMPGAPGQDPGALGSAGSSGLGVETSARGIP